MSDSQPVTRSNFSRHLTTVLHTVTWLVTWPFTRAWRAVENNFLSYLSSRVLRDDRNVYSIRFVWYNNSIYFHPMIWASLAFFLLAYSGLASSGWLLLLWFVGLFVCIVTILYNVNIIRAAILGVGIVAFLGTCYFSTVEWSWNPLGALTRHVDRIDGSVTPGFFLLSMYFFMALVFSEVVWAWLFHRVEIDESYVYEHQFMRGSHREPIFASKLTRETKDLFELLLLGAADIRHQTKKGIKQFTNIPFASLWLGTAIDTMLDHRRNGQLVLEQANPGDMSEDGRTQDAFPDEVDDENGDFGADDGASDDFDDDGIAC